MCRHLDGMDLPFPSGDIDVPEQAMRDGTYFYVAVREAVVFTPLHSNVQYVIRDVVAHAICTILRKEKLICKRMPIEAHGVTQSRHK